MSDFVVWFEALNPALQMWLWLMALPFMFVGILFIGFVFCATALSPFFLLMMVVNRE